MATSPHTYHHLGWDHVQSSWSWSGLGWHSNNRIPNPPWQTHGWSWPLGLNGDHSILSHWGPLVLEALWEFVISFPWVCEDTKSCQFSDRCYDSLLLQFVKPCLYVGPMVTRHLQSAWNRGQTYWHKMMWYYPGNLMMPLNGKRTPLSDQQ